MIKLADSEAGTVGRAKGDQEACRLAIKRGSPRPPKRVREVLAGVGIARDQVFLGTLNAGHPGGTLPLTGRERQPLHPDHLPENLYVADASLLPSVSGKATHAHDNGTRPTGGETLHRAVRLAAAHLSQLLTPRLGRAVCSLR